MLYQRPERARLAQVMANGAPALLAEADEVVRGEVRLFGAAAVPLRLSPEEFFNGPPPARALRHWADYEGRPETWGVEDIKLIWEPARFGWVYPLGRAYALTGDPRYPAAFWAHFDAFLAANPPNMGPNWTSGQEVALRLLALLFAAAAFDGPTNTPPQIARLKGAVAVHARRIPPTLSYARAQNNNHRITEALGMYAAGLALADLPEASGWRTAGWRELNQALLEQIRPDGVYAQHSMNYHRLMLHAALQAASFGQPFPTRTAERLASAARWLLAQVDPASGRGPNLGSNDGANILPLACAEFSDMRPTAQAAARTFLARPALPPGPWDEPGLWLGQYSPTPQLPVAPQLLPPMPQAPGVHRLGEQGGWATLRAERYSVRPSQADQLHVEIWQWGENLARDAGTFRYTASAPWENALARTLVHNTVSVNGRDQMRRAGRFLWLDWAQATRLPADEDAILAEHNGYRRLGIVHRRELRRLSPGGWRVTDWLLPLQAKTKREQTVTGCLHWLLPDWPWTLEEHSLALAGPESKTVRLALTADAPGRLLLVRAGERLAGDGPVSPLLGWFSPTYNIKEPALSLSLHATGPLPMRFTSVWSLPPGETS
jgi:hypothetical protein